MPIASAVITLDEDPELRARALAAMASEPRVTIGPPSGSAFPAVLETASGEEGEALLRALTNVPGVLLVAIVTVDTSLDLETEWTDARS